MSPCRSPTKLCRGTRWSDFPLGSITIAMYAPSNADCAPLKVLTGVESTHRRCDRGLFLPFCLVAPSEATALLGFEPVCCDCSSSSVTNSSSWSSDGTSATIVLPGGILSRCHAGFGAPLMMVNRCVAVAAALMLPCPYTLYKKTRTPDTVTKAVSRQIGSAAAILGLGTCMRICRP